ncbi:MAG: hypothetical protein WCO98_08680 [bacterium]
MISAREIAAKYNYPSPKKLAEILGLKILYKENKSIPGVKVYAELSGTEIIIYPASVGMDEDLLILHEIYHHLAGETWLMAEGDADVWAGEYLKVINS